ncbi:MAG: DUF1877 family protein [Kofleriaceae bacterium]|nr:DUF1877 family protein [Kofleriaceae bacterium]
MMGELRQITPDQMAKLKDKAVIESIMASDGLGLDKLWNALHHVLGGGGGQSAAFDGKALYHYDTGYGPPMYLTPSEVATYAQELASMTEEQIRSRFDLDDMEDDDVYVIPDDPEELVELLGELRAFYQDAAGKGHGMLIYLT